MSVKREKFGGNFAIILAFAGSAVGLGNIWRFPYMVGEYGGATFLVIYLLCSLFISLPILYCESIIGRRGRSGTFGAFRNLAPDTGWKWLGLVSIIGSFIIMCFYSVVGGWSVDYLVRAFAGGFSAGSAEEVTSLFSSVSSSTFEPVIGHFVFLFITALIISLGVRKGIEKFNKVMMPALFILMMVIMLLAVNFPGAGQGVRYLVKLDLSKLTPSTFAYALGQSFFSLSLGVGSVLTYSSYMRKQDDIAFSGIATACFDTVFALIAAFAVIPAVFSAGLEPGAGPSLVFETLPFIFSKLGMASPVLGRIVSILFFLSILMAALTSMISMFEVCTAFAVDEWKMSRSKACITLFISVFLIGCLCSMSFGVLSGVRLFGNSIFSFCDVLTSNYIMMIGALSFSLFVGWKMDKTDVWDEFTNGGTKKTGNAVFRIMYFLVRYIVPVMIVTIFVTNLVL